MKYIFLDTETAYLLEDKPKGQKDIILQLAYILYDTVTHDVQVYDVKCNPGCDICFKTMAAHNITPEMIEGLPSVQETKEYQILKEAVESSDYIFVAHNADFDITVLKLVDIDVREYCQVIDTYIIAQVIQDRLNDVFDMYKLRYLTYKLGVYKKKKALLEKLGLEDKNTYHEALSDIVDLILIYEHYRKLSSNKIDGLIYISNNDVILTYVPFGKNIREKFSDLTRGQLTWLASLDNGNVSYTAKSYI